MASGHDTAENPSEDGSSFPDFGDNIDPLTFEQILEMDDEEDEREFSRSIVFGFFEQAEATFAKMETCLQKGDLSQLSSLGHFLKGSSATLGLTKVKDSCEKIQHFGARKDESSTIDEKDDTKSLNRIRETLDTVKVDYAEAERLLKQFYGDAAA